MTLLTLTPLEQLQSDFNALGASLEAYSASVQTPASLPELPIYIVDNGDYDDVLTARLITYLDQVKLAADAGGVRRIAIFQNKFQMAKGFPAEVINRGLQIDFDTMWSVWKNTTPKERITYLQSGEKYHPSAWRFDDAHNNTPEELAAAVEVIQDYSNAPIWGTFGAEDKKTVTINGKKQSISINMQAYKDAGLLISRQFYRQEQVKQNPKAPTAVVGTWLKSGRIIDGVDLEAFPAGGVTTLPADLDDMLLQCVEAGIRNFTAYAGVEEEKYQIWKNAPALWQQVNRAARLLRVLK